ncbi:hypothetical protein JTB14_033343 [Gonioctena quinquepunctata]|nr:hypothetical protein JTB14_033343 [Gonioctena quinquepunctata]
MIWGRIMLQVLFVITPWESSAITKKKRSEDYTGSVRNFRHIAGSSSYLTDWEVGLRQAVLQALLRESYIDPNLRERIEGAPLIGRQDTATPFGDVAVLARGQLYGIHGGNFAFVQDPYQNDCDDCHNPRRCMRHQCQSWAPHNQEQLIALWTVKRLRHRDVNNVHRYEIEYTISPINYETKDIVSKRGRFNYAIPGHVFVIKSHDNSRNMPTESYPGIYNKKIPHMHFKPDILIGVDTAGYQHVLHSYPGFYTHPIRPTNNQPHYSTNKLKENELYKELLEALAAKTSTTTQKESPHKIPFDHFEGITKPAAIDTTFHTQLPVGEKPPSILTTPISIMTRPMKNNIPTKPTLDKEKTTKITHEVKPSVITTVHYFMPDGEEQLLTSEEHSYKDMNKPTTDSVQGTSDSQSSTPNETTVLAKPTENYHEQSQKPLIHDVDPSLPKVEKTTKSTKPTKKFDKTKVTKPKVTKTTTSKISTKSPITTVPATKPKTTTHIPTMTSKSSSRTTSKLPIRTSSKTTSRTSSKTTSRTTSKKSSTTKITEKPNNNDNYRNHYI